jgi:hypothetical protein
VDIKGIIEKGLDLLYPPGLYCSCCGNLIDESRTYHLCDHCIAHIRWDGDEPKDMDGMKLLRCTQYGLYERTLIFDLKYNGKTYISDQAFVTETRLNEDIVILQGIYFHVDTEPMAIHDTLGLKMSQLPYTHMWPDYTDIVVEDFGDYDHEYTNYVTWCIEHAYLHVYHDVDTITNVVDTTLCQGRIFQYDGVEYTQSTTLQNSEKIDDDTWKLTVLNLAFDAPEMEYDTVIVVPSQLVAGYYYAPTDTLVYAAGDYVFEILQYDECTRMITLTVKTTVATSVDNIPTSNKAKLILRDGMIYILRDEQRYTLLGEKL